MVQRLPLQALQQCLMPHPSAAVSRIAQQLNPSNVKERLPDMREILEDHPAQPIELTVSDRPAEFPAAGAEKGPYWNISAVNEHVPGKSPFLLPLSAPSTRLQHLHHLPWKSPTQVRSLGGHGRDRFTQILSTEGLSPEPTDPSPPGNSVTGIDSLARDRKVGVTRSHTCTLR